MTTTLIYAVSYALVCRLQVSRGAAFAGNSMSTVDHCGLLSCMSESLLVILRNTNECTVFAMHTGTTEQHAANVMCTARQDMVSEQMTYSLM